MAAQVSASTYLGAVDAFGLNQWEEADSALGRPVISNQVQYHLLERRQGRSLLPYADLQGLPPLLIQVGSSETLLDDSNRLTERAKAAGVDATLEVWEDMIHTWQLFAPILPEGQQAIERIGEFLRQHVGSVPNLPMQWNS